MEAVTDMSPNPVVRGLFVAAALAAALQATAAEAITAKETGATFFFFRQNFGAYSKVDRPLRRMKNHFDSKGLEGNLIGIYYDVTIRTSPTMQRADLGIPISEERATAMLREAHPEATEEEWVELMKALDTERGALVEGNYFVKRLPPRLVAASRVQLPFLKFHLEYQKIQQWTWSNGYFIVGPVIEIYHSEVHRNKMVTAEVQIGIERGGVPDRR